MSGDDLIGEGVVVLKTKLNERESAPQAHLRSYACKLVLLLPNVLAHAK